MVSGADSQCAEMIRIADGTGNSAAHTRNWETHSGSSTNGGAPCERYKAGGG